MRFRPGSDRQPGRDAAELEYAQQVAAIGGLRPFCELPSVELYRHCVYSQSGRSAELEGPTRVQAWYGRVLSPGARIGWCSSACSW